jgi:hypothetical protein
LIYPYGSLKSPNPFSDSAVDDIGGQDGRVDQFGLVDLKLSDKRLIENINQRISDSKTYYDDSNGFNLERKRAENLRMYLGYQVDEADFYDQEEPYIENQIRGAIESIVSYCTARSPQSMVTKGNASPEAAKFASNLKKVHHQHSIDFDLRGLLEILVRNWLICQESYMLLEFDPSYGDQGEIVPSIVSADEIVIDKNAKYGQDPDFIAIFEKQTVEDLVFAYPEKSKEIFEAMGIQKRGRRNMTQEVVTKKVYFTYYGEGKKKQGMCVYFDEIMLIKTDDLNWLKNRKNFLRAPMKPIIPLNVLSDGKHFIDFSNFVEDGIKMQKLLNVRGRQVSLNADGSNGTKIINAASSGLTKEDAENWVPGPNKTVFLKRAKPGVPLREMVDIIPGQDLKQFVAEDKQDMRQQIGNVLAVPIDQTDVNSDPTLGQSLIHKNNMNARQDQIVRALDRFLHKYFNLLTQMMFVWYDEDHYFTYEDVDGDFEDIVIKRYYFDEGMRVGVSGGSTIAFDKNREQAMALKLNDRDSISRLDLYRILGFEDPQKMYDNWVKEKSNPADLMRDAKDQADDAAAYAEFIEFMNGKEPDVRDDASRDYILTLRKLMISDKFLKAKGKYRNAFTKRLNKYLDSYELRQSLDQLGQEDLNKIAPGQPVPPPMPAMPGGGQPPQPGMPPQGGAPGMQGPMMPPGLAPGAPGLPPGMGGGMPQPPMVPPTAGGMFSGTPIPDPASPNTPSGIGAVSGF